jgi:hypothetical protein
MADTKLYDDAVLLDFAGPVGAGEFAAARETTKPNLWLWITGIRDLSDSVLFEESQLGIYESALVARSRMNCEDIHCRATTCYYESKRRHRLTHAEDCEGSPIYARAHAQAMRDRGYEPSSPVRACTCSASTAQKGKGDD